MPKLKVGAIISGPNWPEPVEIKLVEDYTDNVRIIGCLIQSKNSIDQIIPIEELDKITFQQPQNFFSEESWKIFLSLETKRYRYASLYDPLLAVNTSKIDPLPHQIEAVYGYVLKLPIIRFLIADDPGAGKTIMAGLIIKELKLRNFIKRILIIAPGHLKDQWCRELKDRFKENFIPVNRSFIDSLYGENIWQRENQLIASMDFVKQEDILPSISATHFDLIIVDEAHKMSAYKYGDKVERTERYRLGEKLSKITDHLLFLTATPHKGDPENFRLFIDLLEPGFFATNEMLEDSIVNKENPLFIRRIKEDLKDFEGKPLFLPRHVTTISFNLGINSKEEKELYNELSKYVENQYNVALQKNGKRNIAFAIVILQRRFASSIYALMCSLERRKKRLEKLLNKQANKKELLTVSDIDEIEDLSEEERWKEEELWETLSVAENREELQEEIKTLENLIEQARTIIREEKEYKLKELKKTLTELMNKFNDPKDRKILIFTESKDTLEYLNKKVQEWGYSVNTIHGGMNLEERVKAESVFKNETDIMIATEAAGEGINLQFCHMMINYDIPWNPIRLEQRMGRIHRYGQQKEVYIYNLVAEDTREGKVLKRLFDKLDEIRTALGSDKVFDVVGEVFSGRSLSQLLLEAAANCRNIDDILNEIEIKVDEEYISKVKENLGESLATRFIDYTRIKEMNAQAREHRLIPEYTENYFKKTFTKAGGKFKERQDGFLTIEFIPSEIRRIAENEAFKKAYGELLKSYKKATFDKDIAFKNPDAEFISFGHPLFEATMMWVEQNLSGSLINGACFIDPDGKMDGYIMFYEGEIKDGTNTVAGKRLFAFYISKEGIVNSVSPSIIWDLAEGNIENEPPVNIDELKQNVMQVALNKLKEYREELLKNRLHQAEIKQKYGIKSLEHLIVQYDGDLIKLYERKEKGEQVDIVIRNKEERKQKYEHDLEELKKQIEKEKTLTMSTPSFVGIIRVKPPLKINDTMITDKEIEKIGMDIAIQYETKQGRFPEDVSSENLGFDIRSRDKDGNIRYIEVKARAESGAIALTQNEWFKAQRFGNDYYLYTIMNAKTNPQLFIIANPAQALKAEQQIEIVRYFVSFEELKEKGIKIYE